MWGYRTLRVAVAPRATGPIGAGRFCYANVACVGGLLPRQISGRRAACPPARRPRRELRSARRLEARPGPAGLATASNRSGACVLPGQAPPPPTGTADHGCRSLALRSLQCGLVRRAEFSGCPDACCYKRRQSEVFFVWISDPLLQTSSIRWLFRRKSRFLDAD